MGRVETFEGVRADALPEEMRVRLGLGADDLVDVKVTARIVPPKKDVEALRRTIADVQALAAGSDVTAANCSDFLYDEDGLPA